jgi:G:T-mismatch repair DNA endonuclease (very short patch repair protein)
MANRLGLTFRQPKEIRQPKVRANAWSDSELELLQKHYGVLGAQGLQSMLKRSRSAIGHKALRLGLLNQRPWTQAEIKELRETGSVKGRTLSAVQNRKHLEGIRTIKRSNWSAEEDTFLSNHLHFTTKQIAEHLQRTEASVSCRMRRLGMLKLRESQLERVVAGILDDLGVSYLQRQIIKKGRGAGWRPDFLLPNKCVIEANGRYWHSQTIVAERDARKRLWYANNGYTLLELWEEEFEDIVALREKIQIWTQVVLKPLELLEQP